MKKKFTRVTAFTIIVAFIFVLLSTRLFYLQIVNGDYYRSIAEANAEREIVDLAPRGELLDRNGKKIATNIQTYNITYGLSQKKRSSEETNKTIIETINIITKNGDSDKLNIKSFPISYDEKLNKFDFQFNTSDPEIIDKQAKAFKKEKDLDENLNAKDTFMALAKKYELLGEKGENKYNISLSTLHKALAVRQSLGGLAYKQYQVVYIANNVSKKTAFEVQYRNSEMPGIMWEVSPMRSYPYKEVGSNFIGYLGKISSKTEDYTNMGYDVSRELIGKDGLEGVLENNRELNVQLRGEPGIKYVNVDKFGRVLKETSWRDAIPGDTVVTTIDMDLQAASEKAFDQMMQDIRDGKYGGRERYPNANRGAMVVLDVNTGEILALVSRPGYDPNLFAETGGIKDPEIYKKLFLPDVKDPSDAIPKPMLNYATKGTAPPGSTFKPFSAIAGLQEGVITPQTIIRDLGVYSVIKGFNGKCWIYDDHPGQTHGSVNVAKALQVSCNYYFYEVGRRLGYEKIAEWAWKFGIGRDPKTNEKASTGIEIDERTGTVGTPKGYKLMNISGKMKKIVEKLQNTKYGGYTLTEGVEDYNILKQMLMDGVVDEKTVYDNLEKIGITNSKAKKYIRGEIKNFNTESSRPGDSLITAIGQGSTALTPLQMAQYLGTLINGGTRYKAHLVKKVLNPDGTVKKEFQPEAMTKLNLKQEYIDVIKEGMKKVTEEGGTASVVFKNYPVETGGKTGTAQFGKNQASVGRAAYGWFLGFAPYDKPQIAIAAVVYDGGHGNYVARAVKAAYDEYFKLNKQQPAQNQQQNSATIPTSGQVNTNTQNTTQQKQPR